jgi:hypothetical protein
MRSDSLLGSTTGEILLAAHHAAARKNGAVEISKLGMGEGAPLSFAKHLDCPTHSKAKPVLVSLGVII